MATEQTPLLTKRPSSDRAASSQDTFTDAVDGANKNEISNLDAKALYCLLLQHTSSMFGISLYSFASYIFLVEIFKDSLAPASLVGLASKLVGLTCSGHIGGIIDRSSRIKFVRATIAVHKVLEVASYLLFLLLLGPLSGSASNAFRWKASTRDNILTWAILSLTITVSSLIGLCNTAMTVSVERDWVTTIAQGNGANLTRLNASMRTISMASRIFPSMVVSVLTYSLGYRVTVIALVAITAASAVIEFWWIQVVYNRFPMLKTDDDRKKMAETRQKTLVQDEEAEPLLASEVAPTKDWTAPAKIGLVRRELASWREFAAMPVFWTSLAVTVRWLDTLKMDGIGVSYFKIARGWDDGYLSLIRAGCLITSLIGTTSGPFWERRLGLTATGRLGICFAGATMAPVVVTFFLPSSADGSMPRWMTAIMLTGIIVSRGGSTLFNLTQIKHLQLDLADHPSRNRLTALQSSLANMFELLRYATTLVFSTSEAFKWTVAITMGAHVASLGFYTMYLRRVR